MARLLTIPATLGAGLVAGVSAAQADAVSAPMVHLLLEFASALVAFVSSILVVGRTRVGLAGLLLALAVTAFSARGFNLFDRGGIVFLSLAVGCALLGVRGECRGDGRGPCAVSGLTT